MVASSLAIQDAGIDLSQVDRSRVAVVFGTGFGCAELTEAFFQSAAANGWSGTDPSPFPEGLANAPASHVALWHGLRGPNITVGSTGFAGESALIQAASLLRHGQADLAIVLAGDTLTRAVYEWYEAAGLIVASLLQLGPSAGKAAGLCPAKGWPHWFWNQRVAGKRGPMPISVRAAGRQAGRRWRISARCSAVPSRVSRFVPGMARLARKLHNRSGSRD